MSSYAITTDLTTLGISSSALGSISGSAQQAALDAASNYADGYLGAAFTLPILTPYPTDLVEAVCKIAAYNLLSSRGFDPSAGADQNIRDRYKDAVHWLEQVAAHKLAPRVHDSEPAGTFEEQGGPFVLTLNTTPTSNGISANTVPSVGAPNPRGW